MTFEIKTQEPSSERFFLVKMISRRYVANGQLSAPNTYNFTIPEGLNLDAIYINNSLISSSDYNYASNQLQINSALNLELVSNVVTVDHNIFLTGTKLRESIGVAGLPDAKWEPLIKNYPQFSQSMKNIAEGVFSLSNSSLDLICTDRWAQSLIGTPDSLTGQYESLSNSPVSVWVCIDSVEFNKKIFDGEVSEISYSYGGLRIEIMDTFQRLNQTAQFGTRAQSYVFTGNGTQRPNPENENVALPIAIGKSSPFTVAPGYKHVDAFGGVSGTPFYHLSDGIEPIIIGPTIKSQDVITTWHAGRFTGTQVKRITFGPVFPGSNTKIFNLRKTIVGVGLNDMVLNFDGDNDRGKSFPFNLRVYNSIMFIRLNNINNFTGEIGDYIPPQYLGPLFSNIRQGAVVCGYGNNLHENYNLALYVLDFSESSVDLFFTKPLTEFAAALNLPDNTIASMSVWVEANESATYDFNFRLTSEIVGFDFTEKFSYNKKYLPFALTAANPYTIGGQSVGNCIFTLAASDRFNISNSKIKCRYSPGQPMSHSDALKFVTMAAGMQVSDASFNQAAIDLAANVSMTVPFAGGEFPSYLEVAEKITSSTLGLLKINSSRLVEYELIKNPQTLATDGIREPVNMLQNETSTQVIYQDLASSIQFENPQLKNIASITGSGPSAVIDFPITRQIHRVDRTKKVEHVLENIQDRKDVIAGYFASPTVEYSLATANEDLKSSIGDVIEINNTAVADSKETTKGLIVALDQSGSNTKIKINEIRGVE